MFRKIVYIVLLCLPFSLLRAQDVQFTQYYAAPLALNPALTGANACNKFGVTYRNQWRAMERGFITQMFYYEHYLPNAHSGVGFQYYNDVAGSSGYRKDHVTSSYAFESHINRKYAFRLGGQVCYQRNSINYKGLYFGDQIARGGAATSVEQTPTPKGNLDFAAGGLFYTSKNWIGVAIHHLNDPNESFFNGQQSKLPVIASVHGGGEFNYHKANTERKKDTHLHYAFHYKTQGKHDQLDVGMYLTKFHIDVGMWYRGLPVKNYASGFSNNDAVCLILGYSSDGNRFNVGYSYDINISYLGLSSGGAHELTMAYGFCDPKSKKKKKRMVINAPKF